MSEKRLIVKGISKAFNGFVAVEGVTATFLPGRITALIGPNGAGKTTLFHVITGELDPDSGRVLYRGEDITGCPPWKVARKGIGRLFQDVRVFKNLSVLDNVVCACLPHGSESPIFSFSPRKGTEMEKMEQKGREVLGLLGLEGLEDRYAGELSFGQQKLLGVARLLAMGSEVLLLDEPTAGVAPQIRKELIEILRKEADSGKTVVVVEHNISVVINIADWVYFMSGGRISFFGRTDHVLGAREVREIYLGLHSKT